MDKDSELNQILNKLTGLENLVSSYDLSMNASGKYVCDKPAAERKVAYFFPQIVKDMALVYMYTYYMYMLLLKKIISKVVRGQNVK